MITGEYNSRLKSPSVIVLAAVSAALAIAGCSSESSGNVHQLTSQEQHGQRIFTSACGVCHKPDSTAPLNGPGLKGVFKKQYLPSGLKVSDQQVRETIQHGRKNMPPMGGLMDDQQMNDLIAYLRTL
jgi:mono/diheme cytochrome c family protein